jgi:predicted transcriptional regulator
MYCMAVLTIRLDDEVEQAIALLTEVTGESKTRVTKDALIEAARRAQQERLRCWT